MKSWPRLMHKSRTHLDLVKLKTWRRREGAVVVKKVGEDLELGKMRTRSTTKHTSPTPDHPTTISCPL